MADPIMDLFDDTPLFNLDSLPDDAFSQGSSDPVEEALKLALGQVDPPADLTSVPGVPVLGDAVPTPVSVSLQTLQPQQPTQMSQDISVSQAPISIQAVPQSSLSVAGSSSGAATVLLSSPIGVPVSCSQVTTQQLQTQQVTAVTQQAAGQSGHKIVILKGPQGQMLQGVTGATGSPGKVTLTRVLTGTPLRPGMTVVSGGTMLNATSPGQGQVKMSSGVQRLVQTANGQMKQVLLTSIPQSQSQVQTQSVQMQIPAQAHMTQGQLQTQPAQVQVQMQQQAQVTLQTQAQSPASAGVRPQGVTLSAMSQQVSLSSH